MTTPLLSTSTPLTSTPQSTVTMNPAGGVSLGTIIGVVVSVVVAIVLVVLIAVIVLYLRRQRKVYFTFSSDKGGIGKIYSGCCLWLLYYHSNTNLIINKQTSL